MMVGAVIIIIIMVRWTVAALGCDNRLHMIQ
jgi:hypothetical protein